ncbi:MAG TPA: hypothetical protein VJM09_05200 [Sphingobium sp.]|nr:hypothetical protein [Sphingobium sp.]
MSAPYRPRHIALRELDPTLWEQPRRPATFVDDVEAELNAEFRDAAIWAFLGLATGLVAALLIVWMQS